MRRPIPLLPLILIVVTGACGLAGGEPPSPRPSSDVPGPFEEADSPKLCLRGARLDPHPVLEGTPGWPEAGFCTAAGVEPVDCASDADCSRSTRCVCGTCRVAVCVSSADCLEGWECEAHSMSCQRGCVTDSDCAAGERCDAATLGCSEPCSTDVDCPVGEVCSLLRGLCVAVPCAGGGCAGDRWCDVQRRAVRQGRTSRVGDDLWTSIDGEGVWRFVPGGEGSWDAGSDAPLVETPWCDVAVENGEQGWVMLAGRDDGHALGAWKSEDGLSWSRLGPVEGVHVAGEGWEAGWVGRPSIVSSPDGWIVAWEGGPGAGIGIGLMGPDGRLDPWIDEPVLGVADVTSIPSWTDIEAVGSPWLFRQDCNRGDWSGVALLFEARGLERIVVDVGGGGPPLPNASIGYARILDGRGLGIHPANPVFNTMSGVGITRSEHAPAIACVSGEWELVYRVSEPGSGEDRGVHRALPY